MRDYVDIGSTPAEEDCAQVGTDDYAVRARRECGVFIHQLRRQFGKEPGTARLVIGRNPHDAGCYYEVRCTFEDSDEVGSAYAYKCESDAWTTWDERAKGELQMRSGV